MPIKLSGILSKILGGSSKPAASSSTSVIPSLSTGKDWVHELDRILDLHQIELDKFYQENIGNRFIRKNFIHLKINEPLSNLDLPKKSTKLDKKIAGPLPASPPVYTDPKRKHLPINSIMEGSERLFRAYHKGLSAIVEEATKDIHQYLIRLVNFYKYTPTNYEFKTLLSDLARGKISGLDKPSKKSIVNRLKVFIKITKDLKIWIDFFKRTEKDFSKRKDI